MPIIADKIIKILDKLESGRDLNDKLIKILKNEVIKRLNRYELINRHLEEKYEMGFEEFESKDIVKQRGYSSEVESDHCDWDMARDGIESMKRNLEELKRLELERSGLI